MDRLGVLPMDLGIRGRLAVAAGGDLGQDYESSESPLRRGARVVLSEREDAAAAMAFLCSDQARLVTGETSRTGSGAAPTTAA